MQRSLFSRLTQTALILFAANTLAAEAPRWYEVELALISYKDDQKIDQENWPEILVDSTVDNEQAEVFAKPKHIEQEDPWQWINWWNTAAESKGLYNIQKQSLSKQQTPLEKPFTNLGEAFAHKAAQFRWAKDLKVVWSEKWRQPIPEKTEAQQPENQITINLKTALNFQDAIKHHTPLVEIEVSGNLHLYRSRYLHLVTDLKVQHWKTLESNSTLDKTINVLPSHTRNDSNIVPSNTSSPLTSVSEIPLRAARIQQSRRMRSTELHYIDHPMLGILVRVTPIEE